MASTGVFASTFKRGSVIGAMALAEELAKGPDRPEWKKRILRSALALFQADLRATA